MTPHNPQHPYVMKCIGCGHGRLFSEPCNDCEIVRWSARYRDAIKEVQRCRNELRRLGAPVTGPTSLPSATPAAPPAGSPSD